MKLTPIRLFIACLVMPLACSDSNQGNPDAGDIPDGGGDQTLAAPPCPWGDDLPQLALPASETPGVLRGESRNASTTCTRTKGTGGPDQVFSLRLSERRIVELQVISEIDTVLAIRRACDDPLTSVACSDGPATNPSQMGGVGGNVGGSGAVGGGAGFGGKPGGAPGMGGTAGSAAGGSTGQGGSAGSGAAGGTKGGAGGSATKQQAAPEPLPTSSNPLDAGLRVVLDRGHYFVVLDEAEAFGVGGAYTLHVRSDAPPQQSACATAPLLNDGNALPFEELDMAVDAPPGCTGAPAQPALYYAANILSGEMLTVRASPVAGAQEWQPVLQLMSTCPEGAEGLCLTTGGVDTDGRRKLDYVNNGPNPIRVILAVSADQAVRGAAFTLSARIRAPVLYGACAAALPINGAVTLVNEDLSEAGESGNNNCGPPGPALFYKMRLLPKQQVQVQIVPKPPFQIMPFLTIQAGCAGSECLASFRGTLENSYTNGGTLRDVIIVVSGAGVRQGTFDLVVKSILPPPGIGITPESGLSTTESGGTTKFAVVLISPPAVSVIMPIASLDTGECKVSPSSLTFLPGDWDRPQFVTVTGVDDAEKDGTQPCELSLGPAGGDDPRYKGLTGRVHVENLDDEPGVLVLGNTTLATTESGGTATFKVVLNRQPSAEVRMPVSSSNTKEATVQPAELVFTTANWNQPQTVTVTGKDDGENDGVETYKIILGVLQSADGNYAGVDPSDLAGLNHDDAIPSILHLPFDEGQGTAVADVSGKGNHGTIVSGATAAAGAASTVEWIDGHVGKAIKLTAPTWVRIPDSDTIDSPGINNAVSISAWVRLDQPGAKDFSMVVSRQELGTRLEHFSLGVFMGLPVGTVHFFKAIGPQTLPLGEWHHMTLTYDGITSRVYVDAMEVSFLDVGWPLAADETALTIGATVAEQDVTNFWNGAIDSVRVFNRELTRQEVQKIAGL